MEILNVSTEMFYDVLVMLDENGDAKAVPAAPPSCSRTKKNRRCPIYP